MPRKVAVVTGSRAEYGLLHLLLREIQSEPRLQLQLLVTGSHLSTQHGHTVDAIEKDGFPIHARIPILGETDSAQDCLLAYSRAVTGFTKVLSENRPDLLVVLGDRYEIMAVAVVALMLKIPLAHIHGGEVTEGALDESVRHSVTKMAHLHFVACHEYRNRVIQLGESPERVFNFGAMGTDVIKKMDFLSRSETEHLLGQTLKNPTFLVTYHPETLSHQSPQAAVQQMLTALDQFPEATLIFTKSNADAGASQINTMLDRYVEKNSHRAMVSTSLGQRLYLSTMKYSTVVVGNSSSGLIEAPALGIPTVNIGTRQTGRAKAGSVVDCSGQSESILKALKTAMAAPMIDTIRTMTPVYGTGDASVKIKDVLSSIRLENLISKSFYNLPENSFPKENL